MTFFRMKMSQKMGTCFWNIRLYKWVGCSAPVGKRPDTHSRCPKWLLMNEEPENNPVSSLNNQQGRRERRYGHQVSENIRICFPKPDDQWIETVKPIGNDYVSYLFSPKPTMVSDKKLRL